MSSAELDVNLTPQWYIPEPSTHHDSDNAQRLIYILKEMGVEVFCNKYVPFGGMDYSFLDPTRPVVLYGHIGCVKDVYRRRIHLSPFAWCNFDDLKCSSYYAWWGQYLVQRKYAFYPLNEIARNRDFIYATFGANDEVFIRPDDNMKTFVGTIVASSRFDSWWRHCRDYVAGPDCLCVVSRAESIEKEWRLLIKEGKVITGSQYMTDGHLDAIEGFPDAVAVKAEEIVKSSPWQPHPIYVMDIALSDGEYRLMECGSVNVAGMYKADLRKMAIAINELLPEEFVADVYTNANNTEPV